MVGLGKKEVVGKIPSAAHVGRVTRDLKTSGVC